MRFAAAVASFAMVLKGSKHTKKSELTEVIQIARDARGTDPDGYRAEFIRLVDLVAGL
jgi:Ca-activated chloride channel family protein